MATTELIWMPFVLDGRALEYHVIPGHTLEGRPRDYPAHRPFRGSRREDWFVTVRPQGADSPGYGGSFPRTLDVGLEQAIEVARVFWDRF